MARLTGGRSLPPEMLAELAARTDGVPLFIEELTKAVLEAAGLQCLLLSMPRSWPGWIGCLGSGPGTPGERRAGPARAGGAGRVRALLGRYVMIETFCQRPEPLPLGTGDEVFLQ